MSTQSQDTFDLNQQIRHQAEKRKTVDLVLLRKWTLSTLNQVNLWASERPDGTFWNTERSQGASVTLERMLHMLNMYGGYNSRMWLAFTSLPHWLEIVNALNAYDKEHATSHYWHLLRLLDWQYKRNEPRVYYGDCVTDTSPTARETRKARRIHDRYARYFGVYV